MKKIISILIALVLAISLTACGGSGGGEGTTNKPSSNKSTLSKYVNEGALGNTDNITISIGKTEKENEEIILNISAPDLLKDLTTIDGNGGSRIVNDIINLRLFRNSDSRFSEAYFKFKGYGQFKITCEDAVNKKIEGETILEEGCFVLVKDGESYDIWAKNEDYSILINVDGKLDEEANKIYRIKDEEEYKTLFNIIKDHFEFAKIKTEKIVKNGIIFTTYNLKSITAFDDDKASLNTKDWLFACDFLHTELEKIGISLVTAHCLTSEGPETNARCTLSEKDAETAESKAIEIGFSAIDEQTFDMTQAENEFTIGGIQFREDVNGPSRGNGKGFIIKTSTGHEYVCAIYPRGSISNDKLDTNTAKAYLEKVISAK